MGSSNKIMIVLAMVLVSLASGQAQLPPGSPDMSCIKALVPCGEYLNVTKPPETCCGPLVKAFETQLECLCAVFNNPSLGQTANINMTLAMELPGKCGVKADPTVCKTIKAPSPTPEASAPGASTPGKGAASTIAWTAPMSGLMFLLAGLTLY